VLSLFRLCHLGHVQLFASQLLPELVQHLAIVHILIQLLYYNTLLRQLIVNPVDQYPLQFLDLRITKRSWINYSTLLMLAYR